MNDIGDDGLSMVSGWSAIGGAVVGWWVKESAREEKKEKESGISLLTSIVYLAGALHETCSESKGHQSNPKVSRRGAGGMKRLMHTAVVPDCFTFVLVQQCRDCPASLSEEAHRPLYFLPHLSTD